MSIPLIITRGLGNGTFSGEIGRVITSGYNQKISIGGVLMEGMNVFITTASRFAQINLTDSTIAVINQDRIITLDN